ncbi:MAG: penicillin acylase family protein [Gammaproteobacteria bacterium]
MRAGVFLPTRHELDSPNAAGEPAPAAPIRMLTPEELDLRGTHSRSSLSIVPNREALVGSNAWAVDGSHTDSGGALVASDMHLGLRVPALCIARDFSSNLPGRAFPHSI